jgi:NADH-quinone oxidoreductase subunit J
MIMTVTLTILCLLLILCFVTTSIIPTPVGACASLIGGFLLLSFIYGFLGAHFAAVIQIIVYAGAIMVVFVFVVMLLNIPTQELPKVKISLADILSILLSIPVLILVSIKILNWQAPMIDSQNVEMKDIARKMFIDYLWPFELISFLLLTALVAAITVAHKNKGSRYMLKEGSDHGR